MWSNHAVCSCVRGIRNWREMCGLIMLCTDTLEESETGEKCVV